MSFIETPRLLILYGDSETMRFIPRGAITRDLTRAYLERKMAHDERDGFGIAWIFNRAYQGKGYATEAARAVMAFAFAQLQIARLYALIGRFNARSIALANRLGMRYDRIVRAYKRDLMRYEAVRL